MREEEGQMAALLGRNYVQRNAWGVDAMSCDGPRVASHYLGSVLYDRRE